MRGELSELPQGAKKSKRAALTTWTKKFCRLPKIEVHRAAARRLLLQSDWLKSRSFGPLAR
jgi:hypothetical protein